MLRANSAPDRRVHPSRAAAPRAPSPRAASRASRHRRAKVRPGQGSMLPGAPVARRLGVRSGFFMSSTPPSDMLLLVRHGRTADNAEGLILGHRDPPLSEAGRAEAQRLAAELR